jgi:hypothetical protein
MKAGEVQAFLKLVVELVVVLREKKGKKERVSGSLALEEGLGVNWESKLLAI